MINLRYHLVSITAIFLALGIGILLGGTIGQSWFSAKHQDFLLSIEEKYDTALKSNNELKQQVKQLIQQVEKSNEEVLHLMAVRYADDLMGKKLYVWQSAAISDSELTRILHSVGVATQPFEPTRVNTELPLLIVGKELPAWIEQLPEQMTWIHYQHEPTTPAKQWELLERVQLLLKEKRWEDEKS